VISNLEKITKYDKFWARYYALEQAMFLSKDYFFSHIKEYTHFVRMSDDTVITPQQMDLLVAHLQAHPEITVLSCVTNSDMSERGLRYYGLCMYDIPDKNIDRRIWNWLPIKYAPKGGIHQVAHTGAHVQFIAKRLLTEHIISLDIDTVAKVTYDFNKEYPKAVGCCTDLVTSHELNEANISQYADFDVICQHLRVPYGQHQRLRVGLDSPYTRFERRQVTS
jgi:hypothetical protein